MDPEMAGLFGFSDVIRTRNSMESERDKCFGNFEAGKFESYTGKSQTVQNLTLRKERSACLDRVKTVVLLSGPLLLSHLGAWQLPPFSSWKPL